MIRVTDEQREQQSNTPTKVDRMYAVDCSTACSRPLYLTPVSAGFPSPAEDYLEGKLDLNKHLIKHPSATFFVKVTGDSMIDVGIHDGDTLIVDRALEPRDGSIVIAVVDGELTVKRLSKKADQLLLVAENENYQPITIHEETAFEIWGVVTNVIHSL